MQPPEKTEELQTRMETAYKLFKKNKAWSNPDKQEKLKSLLAELEALVGEED